MIDYRLKALLRLQKRQRDIDILINNYVGVKGLNRLKSYNRRLKDEIKKLTLD